MSNGKKKEVGKKKKMTIFIMLFSELAVRWRNYSQGKGVLQCSAFQDSAHSAALPGNSP